MRLQLDAEWGLPSPDGTTATCIAPVDAAPRDLSNRVLLAVRIEFCDYEAVAAILPALLAGGAVEEIDEAAYWASFPQSVEA
jgi:hypothetical protein